MGEHAVSVAASGRPFRDPSSVIATLLLGVGTVAALILTIAGAELLVRWWAPNSLASAHGFHVFSETYGWVPRKAGSWVVNGQRVSVNPRGYRGRDLAIPRVGSMVRVVVLGDSIAFGLHVSDEETFAHLLDARDNGIETANLAVQGYGPDQALLVLQHEGLRLDPDVVVLAFCLANDFADAMLPVSVYDGRTPKPRFSLAGDRLLLDDSSLRRSWPRRVGQFLADQSYLLSLLSGLGGSRDKAPGSPWRVRYEQAVRDEDHALQLNLALVGRMNTLCSQRNAAFLVAVFPDRASYGMKPPLAERFMARLEAQGIAVLDMSVPFRDVGSRIRSVALDGTGHLSPVGHSIAADVLERHIRSLQRP